VGLCDGKTSIEVPWLKLGHSMTCAPSHRLTVLGNDLECARTEITSKPRLIVIRQPKGELRADATKLLKRNPPNVS
jgi:hypothetical protein